MDSTAPAPDPSLLTAALGLVGKWRARAVALEKKATVSVLGSENHSAGFVNLRAKVSARAHFWEVEFLGGGDRPRMKCSGCGGQGCEHVLFVLCHELKIPVVGLKDLAAAKSLVPGTKAPKTAVTPPAGLPKRNSESFVGEIEYRLERVLTPAEESYAEAVELLFRRHWSSRMLTANALEPFLQKKPLAAWELVELWPRRPETAWEAWLYLFVFLKNRGVEIPQFLLELTTSEEVAKLAGEWQSQQALRLWEEGLDDLLEAMEIQVDRSLIEVRLMLAANVARVQWRHDAETEWTFPSERQFIDAAALVDLGHVDFSEETRVLIEGFYLCSGQSGQISYTRSDVRERLGRLILHPMLEDRIVSVSGEPMLRSEERLRWRLRQEVADTAGDYLLELVHESGELPPPPLFSAGGAINCYVTADTIFRTAPLLRIDPSTPLRIPAAGLLSGRAMQLLTGLGVPLPENLQERVLHLSPSVRLQCRLEERSGEERLCIRASARVGDEGEQVFTEQGWQLIKPMPRDENRIVVLDESRMRLVRNFLDGIGPVRYRVEDETWGRLIGKRFPEEFSFWMSALPQGVEVELLGDLASFREAVISGSLQLEAEETSPDWFDLHVALTLSDTELTKEEIQLLLEAKGKFVRLKDKGWRKLEFEIEDEQADQLSELGINPFDLNGPPQRYHALQIASSSATQLIEKQARESILRKAEELQTSVAPPVPSGIQADMRGYQVQGFHFLAYLSTNRFGGILADDMGLGKTLQTLTWIAWLRQNPEFTGQTILVVCPKSVVQNWLSESARFLPELRTIVWRGGDSKNLRATIAEADLIVINYAQLRLSAEQLTAQVWGAVVLDEAQYIKNPASQTATAACALQGAHRLALSGTPIENRLLDLWSIMQFAMPGLLGLRAHFNKQYDSRTDALARRRLASRIRPFILRRTKGEVAKDLPARIEEDLVVEMEGTQAQMYRAELKRARQALLKIQSSRELDKQRFNVLTSLLRLRQICCHPGLVSDEHGHADSAKMDALIDLLEPLIERGHKVLVFSQFVEMLARVEREIDARSWSSFILTGETEDRGELVDSFQNHEGPAVFLISLRAGGMGLNLTAASYVVLFDPWWNPAVENQAIDRTHRIGQTQQVIAYRLVAKGSVEEKIRQLQRTKSAMAGDILGEESFGKALTLQDFQFLLEG